MADQKSLKKNKKCLTLLVYLLTVFPNPVEGGTPMRRDWGCFSQFSLKSLELTCSPSISIGSLPASGDSCDKHKPEWFFLYFGFCQCYVQQIHGQHNHIVLADWRNVFCLHLCLCLWQPYPDWTQQRHKQKKNPGFCFLMLIWLSLRPAVLSSA